MAEHEKIIPEYPALDFNFGNYGQGTDYTKDSQRMRDLYYGTNTNPDIRSFSNPDDVVPILQQYGIDFGKGAASAAQMTCLLYTSPSPRDLSTSRMPSSA